MFDLILNKFIFFTKQKKLFFIYVKFSLLKYVVLNFIIFSNTSDAMMNNYYKPSFNSNNAIYDSVNKDNTKFLQKSKSNFKFYYVILQYII